MSFLFRLSVTIAMAVVGTFGGVKSLIEHSSKVSGTSSKSGKDSGASCAACGYVEKDTPRQA